MSELPFGWQAVIDHWPHDAIHDSARVLLASKVEEWGGNAPGPGLCADKMERYIGYIEQAGYCVVSRADLEDVLRYLPPSEGPLISRLGAVLWND